MMKKIFNKGNADWYATTFKDFENRLNGQKSTDLHQLRKKALKSFQELGYPTTKHEEWKYTNTFNTEDLPKLAIVATEAYKLIRLRSPEQNNGT